ncbi:hypothetical protein [Nocardioides marmotae]|uniref:hypothetical protein n=1 Tax=Nocardioides marmotae TaxID=2663857 RepID=UPI0012B5A1EC|nr:hypothetical protein [Nocardioides marmotae]MBC9735145.1 hypothetical protein [Nocardioides marmotae]MTB86245.1 hypothetical protein [Nocardioides marmotae]
MRSGRWTRVAVLGAALAVATVLQAVGLVTGAGPSTATSTATSADGYPQRIGFARPAPPLPDRPGALAGTFYDNDFGNRRALALGPRGQLWALPPGVPSLSPDGRWLLTASSTVPGEPLELHDLVTGTRKVFPDLGTSTDRTELRRGAYQLVPRAARWSGDARSVLVLVAQRPRLGQEHAAVLDLGTGAVTRVPDGTPAGFDAAGRAVTVRVARAGRPGEAWTATATDVVTGAVQRRVLRPRGPWAGAADPRPHAGVSPDGATVALVEAGLGDTPDATVRRFSLEDGHELDPRAVADFDHCEPSWSGEDPVVPTRSNTAHSVLLDTDGPRSLVAVHHRMQSFCLVLVVDALAAGPHESFLGTRDALWTWYWRELLLALTVGATALALATLLLLRRRRRRSGSGSGGGAAPVAG